MSRSLKLIMWQRQAKDKTRRSSQQRLVTSVARCVYELSSQLETNASSPPAVMCLKELGQTLKRNHYVNSDLRASGDAISNLDVVVIFYQQLLTKLTDWGAKTGFKCLSRNEFSFSCNCILHLAHFCIIRGSSFFEHEDAMSHFDSVQFYGNNRDVMITEIKNLFSAML